jgi:hypothetical protein
MHMSGSSCINIPRTHNWMIFWISYAYYVPSEVNMNAILSLGS